MIHNAYDMQLNTKQTKGNILVFLLFTLSILIISPYLSTHVPRIIQVCVWLFWFLLAAVKLFYNRRIQTSNVWLILAVIAWITISTFYKLIDYSSAAWGNYFSQFVFFGLILVFLFVNRHMTERQMRTLAWVIVTITAVNIIDNIRLNILYPGASVMAVSLNWYPWLADTNVGVTSFSTMSLLFFNICFLISLYAEARPKKVLFSVLSIVTAYYIVACGMRASVVLFLLFSFLTGIYIKMCKRWHISETVGIAILLIIVLLIGVFSAPLLRFFVKISTSDRLAERFNELLALLTGRNADEHSFTSRIDLYLLSLKSFVQSPFSLLFGIGDHRHGTGVDLSGFYSSGIGGHSDFIDSLGRYGLLGGFFISYILLKAYKAAIRSFKGLPYEMHAKVIYFVFLLCGLTKAVFFPEIGFMVFLLFPLIPKLVAEHHERQNIPRKTITD